MARWRAPAAPRDVEPERGRAGASAASATSANDALACFAPSAPCCCDRARSTYCSRRHGRLIDPALGQRAERLVGRLFLRQGLLQQPVGLGVAEQLRGEVSARWSAIPTICPAIFPCPGSPGRSERSVRWRTGYALACDFT